MRTRRCELIAGLVLCLSSLWLMLPERASAALPRIQTVFIIMMENHNWADIKTNTSAAYINGTLVPMASHCEQYFSPPRVHPSLPNYLWLQSGTNFGITDDYGPDVHHQNTTNHLTTLLDAAGISWKTYQEGIAGTYVPLTNY